MTTSQPASQRPPHIVTVPVGTLAANCYLLTCLDTGATLLIDPGAEPERIHSAWERAREQLAAQGVTATFSAVLHTHGHFDHISATEALYSALDLSVPLYAHPADAYLYTPEARAVAAQFGYSVVTASRQPDHPLAAGDELAVGALRLRALHTPGHTPGSLSLVCGDACVFTGDTLFRRGVGRTDLPGGDEDALYTSILTQLYTLAPSLLALPGHGAATTIGEERAGNPFIQADDAGGVM